MYCPRRFRCSFFFDHSRAAGCSGVLPSGPSSQRRFLHHDGRNRLSAFWMPTGGIAPSARRGGTEDSHSLLLRAGFLRQAYSGVFQLLPLGLRVQEKIERLVEKHMNRLGASKLSLSSISSEDLWRRSGRLSNSDSDLFHFQDRKGTEYLLSPTHEEEITALVAATTRSYKELPLRLYQITRKYRDEPRPRQGLLRTREFMMKDLYTFDETQDLALKTYQEVRAAYAALFDELKIPYLVAEADSGSMGGNLSHEYHFPTSKGEDHIISCGNCSYVANEELAEGNVIAIQTTTPMSLNNISFSETAALPSGISQWVGVSRDRLTLVRAFYPSHSHSSDSPSTSQKNEINIHAIKATFNALESGVEDPLQLWKASFNTTNPDETATLKSSRILNLIDCRLVEGDGKRPQPLPLPSGLGSIGSQGIPTEVVMSSPTTGRPLNLLRIQDGDICPKCSSKHLKVQKAVELGHTFFLGTRYSRPLRASVATAQASSTEPRPNVPESKLLDVLERDGEAENSGKAFLQMGCHGIGVSRMIAAVADSLADDKGLNWPTVIAPFEVVIIPKTGLFEEAERLCDRLTGYEHTISRSDSSVALGATGGLEVVMDDRQRDFVWKLQDADLVGYPIIVVLGKAWEKHRRYEVQCRRLGLKKVEVPADALTAYIRSLLEQM